MAHLRKRIHQRVDFVPGVHLGHGHQHVILEGGIVLAEIVAAQDAVFEQVVVDCLHRLRAADRELVEEGRIEAERVAGDFGDLPGGVVSLVVTQFGHLVQAVLPKHGQVHGGGQRHQSLVGADVGGGALALDVLLAGGQGQDEGALAAAVHRLADQASGHLVDVLLAGSEEAQVGASVGKGYTERLTLADNHVRAHLAGGFEERQCSRVGGHADQRALGVCCLDEWGVIIDAAKEIRILHDGQRRICVERGA